MSTTITEITVTQPMDLVFDAFFNQLSDANKLYVTSRCMEWLSSNPHILTTLLDGNRKLK